MRRIFVIIILACIMYFLGGSVAVALGVLDRASYIEYAGIVGGLASVAGLFALTRPAFSKADVQSVELDALRSMAETAAQLQVLEAARSRTKAEIGDLEIQKHEMELLVKKASLALFLQEQLAHLERQVLEEVDKNSVLREHLAKADEAGQKLLALNEEIELSPKVKQLREIISAAERKPLTAEQILQDLPFPLNAFSGSALRLTRSLRHLQSILK